ncbi:hypothetical protein LTR36_004889 [Oleoguttula mirabilis]|uniref:Uncharacterized protein n=1 Tax=Oleoguttula mirabilis TaxID=1507867 RepID=A0AAV9JH75_9PEZI|nr:hypothetical protein LTR36_004889 [Oleoguttula mirabilis]
MVPNPEIKMIEASRREPLGGRRSSQWVKLEARIAVEKNRIPETIIKEHLRNGIADYNNLTWSLDGNGYPHHERPAMYKKYHGEFRLINMNDAVKLGEKRLRYMRYMAMLRKVEEVRLHTLNGLKCGKWLELPMELRDIVFEKLVEHAIEKSKDRVVSVHTQGDLDAVSHSLLSLPLGVPTVFGDIEAAVKSRLTARAPINVDFDVTVTAPGALAFTAAAHVSIPASAARIQHLDLDIDMVLPIYLDLAAGWADPIDLYVHRDNLCRIITRDMPLLQSLNVTFNDTHVDQFYLNDRTSTHFLDPAEYTGELVGLIRGIGRLKTKKKYYRFVQSTRSAVIPPGFESYTAMRHALVCEEDDVWVKATEGDPSAAELKRRAVAVQERRNREQAEAEAEARAEAEAEAAKASQQAVDAVSDEQGLATDGSEEESQQEFGETIEHHDSESEEAF